MSYCVHLRSVSLNAATQSVRQGLYRKHTEKFRHAAGRHFASQFTKNK